MFSIESLRMRFSLNKWVEMANNFESYRRIVLKWEFWVRFLLSRMALKIAIFARHSTATKYVIRTSYLSVYERTY